MTDSIKKEVQKAKDRGRDRVKTTAEIFTPEDLCYQMIKEIPEEKLKNPKTTYLDNSCGDGNFLVVLFKVLTEEYGHDCQHVLDHQLYGIDFVPDNIEIVKKRLGVDKDHPHFVCHDALTYDYSFK